MKVTKGQHAMCKSFSNSQLILVIFLLVPNLHYRRNLQLTEICSQVQ
jgi:hypothetical protein